MSPDFLVHPLLELLVQHEQVQDVDRASVKRNQYLGQFSCLGPKNLYLSGYCHVSLKASVASNQVILLIFTALLARRLFIT